MKPSNYRPTRATIDVAAIGNNIESVKAGLPAETAVFAVVKANAYGHGVLPVARYLSSRVSGFCVSNLDEALELRQAGIDLPILVMGVTEVAGLSLAIEQEISLTVSSMEWLKVALDKDLMGLRVHFKVDTGMGRIGFRDMSEISRAIAQAVDAGAVFEGIFTHFATADMVEQTQFDQQLAQFEAVLAGLPVKPRWIHTSNSAAALWHQQASFNMVRLGNVIYGLNPSSGALALPTDIQPALSITSALVQVKQLSAGEFIGYGATYQTTEPEWIGTVPIGYADGFVRKMQGFSVLVDGQECPVVGRVSMDQITIRLPKAYPLGQTVTLLGKDGDKIISAQDWADQQETIHYEVVCLLSDRILRLYHS